MRLMITRPLEDAEPLARALAGVGVESIIEPLLTIELTETEALDLSGAQALLLTSANGLRALAALSPERTLPVFAVGDATARAAVQAGFENVSSAAGDVQTLAELILEKLDPGAGALVHVAGSKVAGDLATLLGRAGFQYRRAELYHASKATSLSAAALSALDEGSVHGVILYSPRTAESFIDLLTKAGVADCAARLNAFCLSQAVATRLQGLKWAGVRVAATPDQAALIKTVREM